MSRKQWYIAVLCIAAFAIFVLLANAVANKLFPDGDVKKLITGIIPPTTVVSALIASLITAFFGSKDDDRINKLITTWGRTVVLIPLIAADIGMGVAYSNVSHPCFGITPANKEKEVVVLMAKFLEKGQRSQIKTWPEKLLILIADTIRNQQVKFIELPESKAVTTEADAHQQNVCYGAILTVWGTEADDVIVVNYTNEVDTSIITQSKRMGTSDPQILNPSLGIVDMPTFTTYVTEGADTKFVLTVLLGLLQEEKDNQTESIQLFTSAIEMARKDLTVQIQQELPFLLTFRGWTYYTQSNYPQALVDYKEAIGLNPDYAIAFSSRGVLYSVQGNYPQALEDFNRAIKLQPDDAVAFYNRGILYHSMGNYPQAFKDFNEVIKLKPDDAITFNTRGVMYIEQGKYPLALNDFNEAIRLQSDAAAAFHNRGLVYYHMGNYPQALKDYTEAIRLKPDTASSFNGRGMVYHALGNYPPALSDYTEAIRLKSDYANAFNNRGVLYRSLGNYTQSLRDYTEAIKFNPTAEETFKNRGVLNYALGKYPQALEDLQKYVELSKSNDPDVLAKIAELKAKLGIKP